MTTKIVLVPTDLSEEDFVIVNGKVHAVHVKQEHQVTLSKHFKHNGNDEPLRKIIRLLNGQGFIHLDISRNGNSTSTWIGTIPADCPAPTHLVEAVVPGIAANGSPVVPGTIFIRPGEREIWCTNLKPNVRYVTNLQMMTV